MTELETLYKKTQLGQGQFWTMFFEGDHFWTKHGKVDGKVVQTVPTYCKGKNEGKANATTDAEQAEKEARAKWTKKKDGGYVLSLDNIDEDKDFYEPMLAHDYKKRKKLNKLTWPMLQQVKLDGMRCVARASGLMSRNGKPITSCRHVEKLLAPFFKNFPTAVVDGELYNHKFKDNFNKILSLVRKLKPTDDQYKEIEKYVQFHIYDVPRIGDAVNEETPYSKRFKEGIKCIELSDPSDTDSALQYVSAVEVKDEAEMLSVYKQHIADGWEGSILRVDGPYQNKRSTNLLKYKDFMDAEFEVICVEEGTGNRAGMAGNIVLKLGDGTDRTFHSNVKGGFAFYKKLLKERKSVVGKMATIEFFELTPDGIPRFPYLKAIRDYE